MISGQVSQTALMSAAARAAHNLVDDEPLIFVDAFAAPLLGERADEFIAYHREHGSHPILAQARAHSSCRSQYAETQLARAQGAGVDQYVVLAAGLDASAYRTTGSLAIFEVDHPATQAWKREQARAAALRPPADLRHVPVDLESDDLLAALDTAGLDRSRPAFVSWLGATMYLTPTAVQATAAAVGRLAPGTELVLDYLLAEECRDADSQAFAPALAAASAEHGEPWRAQFRPEELTDLLATAGLTDTRHIDQAHAVPAHLWERTDVLRPAHLHQLAHAVVREVAPSFNA